MDKILDNLVGENNWSAHCVSLVRCKDRRINFEAWANSINLPFQFFDAVDKLTLKAEDATAVVNTGTNLFLSIGATACNLSHIKLLSELLKTKTNEYFLILEDDAGFSSSNKEALFDFIRSVKGSRLLWEMLIFGYNPGGYDRRQNYNEKIDRIFHTHLSHAYLVNRRIMQYIVDIYEPNKTLAYDWILDLARQQTVCLGPRSTIIDQVDKTSYIGYVVGEDMTHI